MGVAESPYKCTIINDDSTKILMNRAENAMPYKTQKMSLNKSCCYPLKSLKIMHSNLIDFNNFGIVFDKIVFLFWN